MVLKKFKMKIKKEIVGNSQLKKDFGQGFIAEGYKSLSLIAL